VSAASGNPHRPRAPLGVPRFVWHAIGLVLAALLAWLIWRGYQSPDFLFDLGALRLC
jgi:uncharacterized membrane protein YccC